MIATDDRRLIWIRLQCTLQSKCAKAQRSPRYLQLTEFDESAPPFSFKVCYGVLARPIQNSFACRSILSQLSTRHRLERFDAMKRPAVAAIRGLLRIFIRGNAALSTSRAELACGAHLVDTMCRAR